MLIECGRPASGDCEKKFLLLFSKRSAFFT
jgi:hypothetical protein